MRVFYNSNGFAHHRLEDVVEILADHGYDGIALTPDVHHLDPFRSTPRDVAAFRKRLERRGLAIVLESGARFLLDPRRKHRPSLCSREGFEIRQDFYRRLIDLAVELGAPLVSLWSGTADDGAGFPLATLAERLAPVLDHAASRGVTICMEPEPGMRVERIADVRALKRERGMESLKLTLDLGHLVVNEEPPWDARVGECGGDLANVQVDDARRGVHEHLFFGEGEIDLAAMARALASIEYRGPVGVELSRHSHDAVVTSARALRVLRESGF